VRNCRWLKHSALTFQRKQPSCSSDGSCLKCQTLLCHNPVPFQYDLAMRYVSILYLKVNITFTITDFNDHLLLQYFIAIIVIIHCHSRRHRWSSSLLCISQIQTLFYMPFSRKIGPFDSQFPVIIILSTDMAQAKTLHIFLDSPTRSSSGIPSEWVSSFLTAHQHVKGYSVP